MDQLTAFPTAAELYAQFWNKKPFLVKGWLAAEELAELASKPLLIEMATRPVIDSKLVSAPPLAAKESNWVVTEGPFEPEFAEQLRQPRQSLLVQGVDLYDLATARLWQRVAAAPLWLRDNIMASYSTHGGTVGPHVDSYHVFLLQGLGKRQWRVADDRQADEPQLIDGLPLKILAQAFEGPTAICEPGDLLYVPPGFCHHGVSIESSITYSLGFLGPDTAELWQSFGEYLDVIGDSEDSRIKGRYRGGELSRDDSGFRIAPATIAGFKRQMAAALEHPLFHDWLGEYFSSGHYPDAEQDLGHEISEDLEHEESYARAAAFMDKVLAGSAGLVTVFPFKVAITSNTSGKLSYQVAGLSVQLTVSEWQVVHALIQLEPVTKAQLRDSLDPNQPESDLWPLLLHLWEEGFLAFR